MKYKLNVFMIFAYLVLVTNLYASEGNVYMSIKNHTKERIVGIEITCDDCTLVKFNKVPKGWQFNINNSSSDNVTIKGDIDVGAAAIDFYEINKLFIFNQTSSNPIVISGTIYTTSDFERTNKIKLGNNNISLKYK